MENWVVNDTSCAVEYEVKLFDVTSGNTTVSTGDMDSLLTFQSNPAQLTIYNNDNGGLAAEYQVMIFATIEPASGGVNVNVMTLDLTVKHWCHRVIIDSPDPSSAFPFAISYYIQDATHPVSVGKHSYPLDTVVPVFET